MKLLVKHLAVIGRKQVDKLVDDHKLSKLPRLALQTKPECIRKQTSSENVIVPSPIGTPSSEGAALASGAPPPGPRPVQG